MNYIFQLGIIFGISLIGALLHVLLPLPVPASVYGMILLFILLCTKLVPLEKVEAVSEYMISVMPIFFIEPSVGIIESFGLVKGQILSLFLASFLSFAAVVATTGLTAQAMIRFKNKRRKKR